MSAPRPFPRGKRYHLGVLDFDVEVKRDRGRIRLTVWWSGLTGKERISGLITVDEAATIAEEFQRAVAPRRRRGAR